MQDAVAVAPVEPTHAAELATSRAQSVQQLAERGFGLTAQHVAQRLEARLGLVVGVASDAGRQAEVHAGEASGQDLEVLAHLRRGTGFAIHHDQRRCGRERVVPVEQHGVRTVGAGAGRQGQQAQRQGAILCGTRAGEADAGRQPRGDRGQWDAPLIPRI